MTYVRSTPMGRHELRLLKALAKDVVKGFKWREEDGRVFVKLKQTEHSFPQAAFHTLTELRWIATDQNWLKISRLGIEGLKAFLNPDGAAPNRELRSLKDEDGNCREVLVNLEESPLSRLASRKDKAGKPYITQEQFEAGERLRHDFERGQLQPRVSAKLDGAIGRAGTRRNTAIEVSDFAMDARRRFQDALEAVGPEFCGLVMDVCGFLKGLEQVERERRWPPRSAKLMLKTALSILARHYGLTGVPTRPSGKIAHWGDGSHKPTLVLERA